MSRLVVVVDWGRSDAPFELLCDAQPFHSPERELLATGDLRLDNREELIDALGDDREHAHPDMEILVLGYARWGVALAEHIEGDFAFVIWDGKKKTLYAARDPFGLRPLCYAVWNGKVVLTSEPAQVLGLVPPTRTIDGETVLDFLLENHRDVRGTFFSQVRRLAPGHYLTVTHAGVFERRYFFPPREGIQLANYADYVSEARRLCRRAVEVRLRSPQPITLLLSGGIDSSALACLAAEIYRREPGGKSDLHLLSAVFPGLPCDESKRIELLTDRLRQLPAERFDATSGDLEPLADEPFDGSHPFPFTQAATFGGWSKAIKRRGARVILSGLGGDQLFFETGVFRDLVAQGRLLSAFRETRLAPNYSAASWRYWLRDAVLFGGPPRAVWRFLQELRRRWRPPAPPVWLGPKLREIWPDALYRRPDSDLGPWLSHSQERTFWSLTSPYGSWLIERLQSWAMRHGCEFRLPFYDVRLARFVLAMPFEQRIPHGRMKALLRDSMAGVAPDDVRERRGKTSFNAFVCYDARRNLSRLRRVIEEDPRWESEPYVNRSGARLLLHSVGGDEGESRWRDWRTLWYICMLESWLRELNG